MLKIIKKVLKRYYFGEEKQTVRKMCIGYCEECEKYKQELRNKGE